MNTQSLIPTIDPGGGRIVVRSHSSKVVFSELSATYPLKLLSPHVAQHGIGIVYVLSYGGGLVGGDHVQLTVDVGQGSILLLLSQVSPIVTCTWLSHTLRFFAGLHKSVQDSSL